MNPSQQRTANRFCIEVRQSKMTLCRLRSGRLSWCWCRLRRCQRVVREAMSDADLVVRKRPWWSGYADVSGGARVNSPASGSVRIWRATRRLSLARSPSVSLAVVPVPRAWQMSLARIGAVAA